MEHDAIVRVTVVVVLARARVDLGCAVAAVVVVRRPRAAGRHFLPFPILLGRSIHMNSRDLSINSLYTVFTHIDVHTPTHRSRRAREISDKVAVVASSRRRRVAALERATTRRERTGARARADHGA